MLYEATNSERAVKRELADAELDRVVGSESVAEVARRAGLAACLAGGGNVTLTNIATELK